jgi:uncharacterized protein YjiS (DUF1127 family)
MIRATPLPADTLAYLGSARSVPTLAHAAVGFAVCVSRWAMRRQTRKALKQLENWQLDDVGLTPLEAQHETSKAFWRA